MISPIPMIFQDDRINGREIKDSSTPYLSSDEEERKLFPSSTHHWEVVGIPKILLGDGVFW